MTKEDELNHGTKIMSKSKFMGPVLGLLLMPGLVGDRTIYPYSVRSVINLSGNGAVDDQWVKESQYLQSDYGLTDGELQRYTPPGLLYQVNLTRLEEFNLSLRLKTLLAVKYQPEAVLAECRKLYPGDGKTKILSLIWPVIGTITTLFSNYHHGIDIDKAFGYPIKAAESGVVNVGEFQPRGYGSYVTINHNEKLLTLYGHMSEIDVSSGDYVKKGSTIGKIGSTGQSFGPHLHFTILQNNGECQDVNPFTLLPTFGGMPKF